MKNKEYGMKHIKALFKVYIHTNQPVYWEYIERKARNFNIDMDVAKILYAEVKCGL